MEEGNELIEVAHNRREMISFYQKLYCESENCRPTYNINPCPVIGIEDQQDLHTPFEEDEVLLGLKA